MVLCGTLLGGTDLRYTDVAFSRDGARVAAFGNRTDHLATVWNVKKESTDEAKLTGEKVTWVALLRTPSDRPALMWSERRLIPSNKSHRIDVMSVGMYVARK